MWFGCSEEVQSFLHELHANNLIIFYEHSSVIEITSTGAKFLNTRKLPLEPAYKKVSKVYSIASLPNTDSFISELQKNNIHFKVNNHTDATIDIIEHQGIWLSPDLPFEDLKLTIILAKKHYPELDYIYLFDHIYYDGIYIGGKTPGSNEDYYNILRFNLLAINGRFKELEVITDIEAFHVFIKGFARKDRIWS